MRDPPKRTSACSGKCAGSFWKSSPRTRVRGAGTLSDLEVTTEDLVEKVGESPGMGLKLYMLAFDYEGARRTHAAIVID